MLLIGNSLTAWNDLPAMLRSLLASAQIGPVRVDSVAFANFGLEDHWTTGPARQQIASGQWDFVVVQQGPSASEGRPSLLEYGERFAAEIRSAGGQVAFYMVWPAASRAGDFDGVSDSYAAAAQRTGGLLFPVGEAWRAAWRRAPNLPLYGPDGFHPSALGSYLAAVVMYQQLSGRDPRQLPARIPSSAGGIALDREVASVLYGAAVEANQRFASGDGDRSREARFGRGSARGPGAVSRPADTRQ